MELPRRERGDELLKPGELAQVRHRLRQVAAQHDLATVIACAFDHRTRLLPFLYADLSMAPAGVRAIGSAMLDAGFTKTRIVLQQWNPQFRPSQMVLDGRVPDLFMVSSMSLHGAQCDALVRDACRIDPSRRPLIIVGGPRVIYEPWTAFHADPNHPWGADVAVTGEEYVLLHLLEVLLAVRARHEPLRSAFERARADGALDEVPGLVYAESDARGVPLALIDTGLQRLVGDLDELPHPVLGYQILEPPSSLATLGPTALPARQIRHQSRVASLVLTYGCQFRCPYCPIPAYNQRQLRGKSGERIADEFEHLLRTAGLWALWLGVEDMSGALVKKGQTADRTLEAFAVLRRNGIYPNPMLMHHDAQPLLTWRDNRGLLNQVGQLRRAGALNVQILMLTPATGAKSYEETFTSGMAFDSVDGVVVEPAQSGGLHVVASHHPRPWVKQLNILAGYAWFFNPLRLLWALVRSKGRIPRSDEAGWPPPDAAGRPAPTKLSRRLSRTLKAHLTDALLQVFGMWGLGKSLPSTLAWTRHLLRGPIVRRMVPPASQLPMRSADGGVASHALPGTPRATVSSLGATRPEEASVSYAERSASR